MQTLDEMRTLDEEEYMRIMREEFQACGLNISHIYNSEGGDGQGFGSAGNQA